MIVDYWYRRGFQCVIRLEKSRILEEAAWVVRSDMINGLPRRRRDA
jgi:hypothetical protein